MADPQARTLFSDELLSVAKALGPVQPEKDITDIILRPAISSLGAVAGAVLLINAQETRLDLITRQGYEQEDKTIWQDGPLDRHVPAIDAIRTQEPLFFEDSELLKQLYPELERETGVISPVASAVLPILLDGRALGVLVLDFREPHVFTPGEKQFLNTLALQCAAALDRSTQYARLLHQVQELNRTLEQRVEERTRQIEADARAREAFIAFTQAVGTETDVLALARHAIRVLRTHFQKDSTFVYYEREGNRWQAAIWTEDLEEQPELLALLREGLPLDTPLYAQAERTREPVFTDRWEAEREKVPHSERYGAAANVPLIVGGEVRSFMALGLRHTHGWNKENRGVVRAVGRGLNLALERTEVTRQLLSQRQSLEAANEELEAFTYSVSHDLRAPVQHIMSFNQMLRRHLGEDLDAKAIRHLQVVHDAAVRMNTLIDAMLDLSRMARLPLKLRPVDLNMLVEAVRTELEADALERQVEWEIGELPLVVADPDMLRQVVVNLLDNALKYTRTREVARIEVRAEEHPGEWMISVRDNGVGFDPQYVNKLFGVFQRLHLAKDFEGTGVGLANVRRIIARHGGQVWAEGKAGGGATFKFSLPRG